MKVRIEHEGKVFEGTIPELGATPVDPPPVDKPPIVVVPPPAPPVAPNVILLDKAHFSAWGPGNNHLTSGGPSLHFPAGTITAIKFPASLLTQNGIGFFSTYESTPLEACISPNPGAFDTDCRFTDTSGKGGIKFVSPFGPNYEAYGYKRLPAGETLYVNIRSLREDAQAILLYGY